MTFTHKSVGVHRVTNLEGTVGLDHTVHKRVVDRLVKKNSAESSASLSAGSDCSENTTLESDLKVGIRHNDRRVVASKLEDGAAKARMNLLRNHATNCGGASERNKRNPFVNDYSLTHAGALAS
jgi:hypothetical protein